MAASRELLLPDEMWESVMAFLEPADLCKMALASKYLCEMATTSNLWFRISMDHLNTTKLRGEGLVSMFDVTRFSHIKHLDLSVVKSVDHSLFRLPTVQLNDLFDFIIKASYAQNLTITSLNLKHENLSDVNQFNLALAVSFLETVDLSYTRLTSRQCNVVVRSIESSSPIQELALVGIFLSRVPAFLLSSAVNSLRSADLSWTRLTIEQCSAILASSGPSLLTSSGPSLLASSGPSLLASSGPSLLTDLNITGANLYTEAARVPIEILSCAGRQLSKINLSNVRATAEQYEALLEGSLDGNKLMEICLEDGNLGKVPALLLSRAVSRLTACDLSCTYLETDQLTSVLSGAKTSTTLRHLSLDSVDLSGVEAGLLAGAVARLSSVDLSATNLVNGQAIALIDKCVVSKRLWGMKIKFVDLKGVPSDLMEKAREKFRLN